jgi:hypothetical protein
MKRAARLAAKKPSRVPVAHWSADEWRKNADDLVRDPKHPQASPATYPMDLMGRIRVKLTAEDGDLVAYGFGRQRIVLPHKSIGAVRTVDKFHMGTSNITRDNALLVLDCDRKILLRADGLWETYGEVQRICQAAKLPSPTHISTVSYANYQPGKYQSRPRRQDRTVTPVPRYIKAPQYKRLRVRPGGWSLRLLAVLVLYGVTTGLAGFLGAVPAVALPEWFGAVRTLLILIGVSLGASAGAWTGAAILRVWTNAVRWAGASWAARMPAPASRFFSRPRERSSGWQRAANVGLAALFVALIGWGPGVGTVTLAHGFRDAALVAGLRENGVATHGTLVDAPDYETSDNGNVTEKDVSTLSFTVGGHLIRDDDPSIGGRPLPLAPGHPLRTSVPETVVYLPDNLNVAAAKQQITGSVWHGAPTANLISGGLLTLALPPVILYLVLRVRRLRWKRASGLVEDLAA